MFIILGHQRSGTHLLASLLDSHPDLTSYGEVLIKAQVSRYFPTKPLAQLGDNEGCIVMYDQFIGASDEEKNIICRRAKVLHLMRRNLMRHALSWYYLQRRLALGMDTHYEKEMDVPVPKVERKEIERAEGEILRYREWMEAFHFSHMVPVYYEELTGGEEITKVKNEETAMVLEFLDVPNRVLRTKFKKTRFKPQ